MGAGLHRAPALRWDGERFTVFYAGAYNNAPQQIGWATSPDGRTWSRGADEPWCRPVRRARGTIPSRATRGTSATRTAASTFFQGNPDDGHTWLIAATELTFVDGTPTVQWDRRGDVR